MARPGLQIDINLERPQSLGTVQLRSADGGLLESRPTQLRELLLEPDGEVRVVLSGKISGDTVALSLSKDGGAKKK